MRAVVADVMALGAGQQVLRAGFRRHRTAESRCNCEKCDTGRSWRPPTLPSSEPATSPSSEPATSPRPPPSPQSPLQAQRTPPQPPPPPQQQPACLRIDNLADGSTRVFPSLSESSGNVTGAYTVGQEYRGDIVVTQQTGTTHFTVRIGQSQPHQLDESPLRVGHVSIEFKRDSATLSIQGDAAGADLSVMASCKVALEQCSSFGAVIVRLQQEIQAAAAGDITNATLLTALNVEASSLDLQCAPAAHILLKNCELAEDLTFDATHAARVDTLSCRAMYGAAGMLDLAGDITVRTDMTLKAAYRWQIEAGGQVNIGGALMRPDGVDEVLEAAVISGRVQTGQWRLQSQTLSVKAGGCIFSQAPLQLSGKVLTLATGSVFGSSASEAVRLEFDCCEFRGLLRGGVACDQPLSSLVVSTAKLVHDPQSLVTAEQLVLLLLAKPDSTSDFMPVETENPENPENGQPLLTADIATQGALKLYCTHDLIVKHNMTAAAEMELVCFNAIKLEESAALTAGGAVRLASRHVLLGGRIDSAAALHIQCQRLAGGLAVEGDGQGALDLAPLLAHCRARHLHLELDRQDVAIVQDVQMPSCTITTGGAFTIEALASVRVRGDMNIAAEKVDLRKARLFVSGDAVLASGSQLLVGNWTAETRKHFNSGVCANYTWHAPNRSFLAVNGHVRLASQDQINVNTTEVWVGKDLTLSCPSAVLTASLVTVRGGVIAQCQSITTTSHPVVDVRMPVQSYIYPEGHIFTVETSRANYVRVYGDFSLGANCALANVSSVVNVLGRMNAVDGAPFDASLVRNTNFRLAHKFRHHRSPEGTLDSQNVRNTAVVAMLKVGEEMVFNVQGNIINEGVIDVGGPLELLTTADVVNRMATGNFGGARFAIVPLHEQLRESALFQRVQTVLKPVVPLGSCQRCEFFVGVVVTNTADDLSQLREAQPIMDNTAMTYALELASPESCDIQATYNNLQHNTMNFLRQQPQLALDAQPSQSASEARIVLQSQQAKCLLDTASLPLDQKLLFWRLQPATTTTPALLVPYIVSRTLPQKAGEIKAHRMSIAARNIQSRGGTFKAIKGDANLVALNNVDLQAALHVRVEQVNDETTIYHGVNTPSQVLAARNASVKAGQDINLTGSGVVAEAVARLAARGNVTLKAAHDLRQVVTASTKRGSLGSSRKVHTTSTTTKVVASEVAGEAVEIRAGDSISAEAPHLRAGAGGICLSAKKKISVYPAIEEKVYKSMRIRKDAVWTQAQLSHSESLIAVDGWCQLADGARIEVSARDCLLKLSQRQNIADDPLFSALAKLPKVQVQRLADVHRSSHSERCGLSAPAAFVLTAAVAGVLTGPAASLAGSITQSMALQGTVATVSTAAIQAGVQFLGPRIAVAVVGAKGDLGQAVDSLAEDKDLLLNMAESMLKAGIFASVCGGLGIPGANAHTRIDARSLAECMKRSLAHTVSSTVAKVALGRGAGDFGHTALRGAVGELRDLLSGATAEHFQGELLDKCSNVMCQTGLGAACGALMDGSALAGAVGAFVGSVVGEAGFLSLEEETASVRIGEWLSKGLAAPIAMALSEDVSVAIDAATVAYSKTASTRREQQMRQQREQCAQAANGGRQEPHQERQQEQEQGEEPRKQPKRKPPPPPKPSTSSTKASSKPPPPPTRPKPQQSDAKQENSRAQHEQQQQGQQRKKIPAAPMPPPTPPKVGSKPSGPAPAQQTAEQWEDTVRVRHAYVIRRKLGDRNVRGMSLGAPRVGIIAHSGLLLELDDGSFAIAEYGLNMENRADIQRLQSRVAAGGQVVWSPDGLQWDKQGRGAAVTQPCTLAEVKQKMLQQPGPREYKIFTRNCHSAQEHVRRELFNHDVRTKRSEDADEKMKFMAKFLGLAWPSE